MNSSLWHVILLTSSALSGIAHPGPIAFVEPDEVLYENIMWTDERPEYDVFHAAMAGYHSLQDSLHIFTKPLVTVIDFSRPSTVKRLWVIDLDQKKVLLNTFVAHGRNSGELMATRFSNTHESFQSSLGFYKTGNTYIGKHGLSLTLEGLEYGINDQAASRAIVVHGADYVSERYAQRVGRLGRSQGCPAVSMEVYRELIGIIKDHTCLFIYSPSEEYEQHSKLLSRKPKDEALAFHPHDMLEGF